MIDLNGRNSKSDIMMRSLKDRTRATIILTFMIGSMFISTSYLFLSPINDETADKNLINIPYSSESNYVQNLIINGTVTYEEGKYYCYILDDIFFYVNASSDVDEVYLVYNHSLSPAVNELVPLVDAQTSNNDFNATVSLDSDMLLGTYDALIVTKNSTNDYKNYTFYLEVQDTNPIIPAVWVRDSKWNDQWVRIYEGQKIQTFRDTTLTFMAAVANPDDLSSGLTDIKLTYFDGNNSLLHLEEYSMVFDSSGVFDIWSVRNYTSGTEVQTDFDEYFSNGDEWTLGGNFGVNITAYDDALGSWVFEAFIHINNRAPEINYFEVEGGNIPIPSTSGDTVRITVNSSDLEDNKLYDDQANLDVIRYAYTSTVSVSDDNASIMNPKSNDLLNIDGISNDVNLEQNGEYYANFSMGAILEDHIDPWSIEIVYNCTDSPDIYVQAWNYNTLSWDAIGLIDNQLDGNPGLGWVTDSYISADKIGDYVEILSGYILRVRLISTNPIIGGIDLEIDYLAIKYTADIRVSTPKVLLGVYGPNSQYAIWRDIKLFHNASYKQGNWWSYDYKFGYNGSLFGVYTFVVMVYDYGYNGEINPNEIDAFPVPFEPNSQASAFASYLVNYGVDPSEINNYTDNGLEYNTSRVANYDEDILLELTVNDNQVGDSREITVFNSPNVNEYGYQDGFENLTTSPNWDFIPSNKIINNSFTSDMLINDGEDVQMWFDEQDSALGHSVIFSHYLNDYYWLGKENITGIKFHLNSYYTLGGDIELFAAYVDYFNWETNDWTVARWASVGLSELRTTVKNSTYYSSDWDDDTNIIKQCVDENQNNRILVRVRIILSGFGPNENINFSVDYESLEIRYDNTFSAIAHFTDSNGAQFDLNMSQRKLTGNRRLWNVTLPNTDWLAKDYIVWFEIQNGNSSVKLIGGKSQPISKGTYYLSGPYIDFNIERAWDQNYTFSVKPRPQSSTFYKNYDLNIYREIDMLMINGTLDPESILNFDQYLNFFVEFRRGGTQTYGSWTKIKLTSSDMDYNSDTGEWNITHALPNTIPAGQYFYRFNLKSLENEMFVSGWRELRIHNFQPQDFVLNSFPSSGNFYRENTIANFDIDISDVESDEEGLQTSFILECLDRTATHEKLTWSKVADTQTTSPLGGNLYNLVGTFKYGREIHVGTYNEMYIIVTDDDPYWPQTGKLRVPDFGINILNNAPVMSMAIDSDKLDDTVFRNNSMLVYWNITDLDDWDNENFTINTWTIDYPNATQEVFNEGNRAGKIEYNEINHRWEYERFYNIYDSFGTYVFTMNYEDPDGAVTSNQNFNAEIMNNLPYMLGVSFENLDRDDMYTELILDSNGESILKNNLSDFVVYRAYETIRFTVNLTDVEDSFKSIQDYNISEVYFKLENKKFTDSKGVYTGADQDSRDYSTFTMAKSGSSNGIETWTAEFELPSDSDFYAGGYNLFVYMKDDDAQTSVNKDGEIGVYNNQPYFFGDKLTVYVNTTKNPTMVGFGEHIELRIYATDDDPITQGISKIIITYLIQTDLVTPITKENVYKLSEAQFQYNATGGYYELLLHTDPTKNYNIPSDGTRDITAITIKYITVYDNDAGNIDTTDYGDPARIYQPDYMLIFYTVAKPPIPWGPIIGSIAAVGAAVFGVVYYKKHFSYRKYMD